MRQTRVGRTGEERQERGTVMVIAALAMTALLLFGALAIDVGAIWSSRTQSQNADDAAALAAASKMIFQTGDDPAEVRLGDAQTEGALYAGANATVGEAVTQDKSGNRMGGVNVLPAHFTFGNWDLDTRTFTPLSGAALSNPDLVRAVQVDVHMDGTTNNRSPAFLSRLLGISGFTVTNTAIAYLGFQAGFTDEFDWPVAIDSCDLSDEPDGCGSDFCAVAGRPPSTACPLDVEQDDSDEVVCLEFSNTDEQNACWTNFDPVNTNASGSRRIIQDGGYHGTVEVGDPIDVTNGDEASATSEMYDRFYGQGSYNGRASGSNEYGPTANIDSWVIKLPVIECQDVTHCAGSAPADIVGGVCFEVREIIAPGGGSGGSGGSGGGMGGGMGGNTGGGGTETRLIKGRFLCPNSTNDKVRELFYEHCDTDGPTEPGGCNYGFSATRVVLVR